MKVGALPIGVYHIIDWKCTGYSTPLLGNECSTQYPQMFYYNEFSFNPVDVFSTVPAGSIGGRALFMDAEANMRCILALNTNYCLSVDGALHQRMALSRVSQYIVSH